MLDQFNHRSAAVKRRDFIEKNATYANIAKPTLLERKTIGFVEC